MADIAGTYTSPYTSPTFVHAISYSESSRDGSSVTYAFTIQSHMTSTSSSFGYSLGWSLTINGQNFTGTIKNASPTWSGTTVYTTNFSVSVSCGAGGGTLSAELWVTRPGNEGNSGKLDTGSCTVNVSSWNTAPVWQNGAWCTASPSGTIAENVDTLTISWGGQYDTEGNTLYFTVKRYINGSYNATIASGTTATSVSDYIGTGNQGTQYYYSVEMHDGSLWASNAVWSNTVTKNTFTVASLSTSSSVGFSSTSVTFSYSGASNTNGNGTFSYSLSCSNVTVYNPTSTPTSVTIYKSGTLPTGTYIKFDDIKSATSSNSYTGTFTFTLTTSNAYNSSGTSSCTMWVDLRVNPTAFTITGTGGYYTIASTNYYVSNRQNPTVTWGASTDQLGGSISYDVQVKLGSGNFYTVLTNLTTTSASVPIGAVSSRTSCIFRVIAKTSFGYTNQADLGTAINLDYYNPPTITFTSLTRNINDVTVAGTVTINTSITGIAVTTLTYSGKTSGSLTLGTSFTKQETGLAETDAYTFSVTAQDGAGAIIGTSATTNSISVARYTPMLSVREKGVGVNALADDTYKFVVGGNAKVTGSLNVNSSPVSLTYMGGVTDFNNALTEGGYNVGSGSSIANAPYTGAIYGKLRVYVNTGGTHNNTDNWIWQYFDNTAGGYYVRYKVNNAGWTGWAINYTSTNLSISSSSVANAVVQRDGNGYIYGSYFNSNRGMENTTAESYLYDTGDGFMRKKSLANVRAEILNGTASYASRLRRYPENDGYWISHTWQGNVRGFKIVANNDVGDNQAYIHNTSVDFSERCLHAGQDPAYTWSGTLNGNGTEVQLNHYLGYYPIVVFDGNRGNLELTWGSYNTSSISVCNWNSGGNNWTGTIRCY